MEKALMYQILKITKFHDNKINPKLTYKQKQKCQKKSERKIKERVKEDFGST